MAKKEVVKETSGAVEKKAQGTKINDGMCCRCVSRSKIKTCINKKSKQYGKYVPRKSSCGCFKYKD